MTSVYPNCELVPTEPCEKCKIKFSTSSTSLDLNYSHLVAGNRVVLKIWRQKPEKNFQLKIKEKQMFSMECFSLPPSKNYLDPFDRFFSLVATDEKTNHDSPKKFEKKVNLFRAKLSSLISSDQVSFISPS